MRVAGLISGTSVDGIDVAIADIDDINISLIVSRTVPYPLELRQRILAASNATVHVREVAELNFLLGEVFASALRDTMPMEHIELIGSHGQTIFHQGREPFCTLQIGEPAVIAERTGKPVIADFRVSDIAAGGRGAPLAPFLDYRLFAHPEIARIALNIGGIANITVLPSGAQAGKVVAFDTGPGNMVMDALAPPFDRGGEQARSGEVNASLLDDLLADPYYKQAPPKTAGREQYGQEFLASGIDLATATELTARTIALAIEAYPDIEEVVVSGGGAHNTFLMERLRALINAKLVLSSDLGVNVDTKEALLFALLAYETWLGRPSNIPTATGARHAVVLGKLCGRAPAYNRKSAS